MVDTPISKLVEAGALAGDETILISQLSTTVTISAATISALASDNSYNDSANGFVAAGFAVGDYVHVAGFTGDVANNIFSAEITALTAGKMTIGGADGNVIVDDAAGETVVISKWVSRRLALTDVPGSGGGGGEVLTPPVLADFATALNIGSETTLTDIDDGMSMFVDSTGTSGTTLRCRLKAYPSTPVTVIFKLRVTSDYSGSDGVGLMIRDSSGGRMIKFGIELAGAGGPVIQHWTTSTSFSSTVYGGSGGQGSDYYAFKFEDDGTNHKFYVSQSIDGPWFLVRNVSRTVWLPSMNQIGFGIEDQNASYYHMVVRHYEQA